MSSPLVRQARALLVALGYAATNLVQDCSFTWRAEDQTLKNQKADLIAFYAQPHTMRTACVGVFDVPTRADVSGILQKARFLTAPVAIIGTAEGVSLYPVHREPVAQPLDTAESATWPEKFRSRLRDLSPDFLYATKTGVEQLTLFDTGLWEWAQSITGQTLTSLLESLLAHALTDLPDRYRDRPAAHTAIIRLILQMFACRVLEDKGLVPGGASLGDTLRIAHDRFSENIDPSVIESPYLTRDSIDYVESELRGRFAFATLTTEMLGSAYENALVTPKLRKERGIYYTPRSIANYMLAKLPVETLPLENRLLCDPCCGSGSFLLAGFDRLFDLLPNEWTPSRRHQYLRTRIWGFDIDDMAREIAGLSLVLADPYNKDGWKIRDRDAMQLTSSDIGQRPTIIATNPPFRELKSRGLRQELASEIVTRLIELAADDGLLAVVTPQSLLESRAGKDARRSIVDKCDLLEIDVLAGGLFYSDAETAVLLLRKRPKPQITRSRVSVATVREVRARDVAAFKENGTFTRTYSVEPSSWRDVRDRRFVLSPLSDIWKRLESRCCDLASVAEVRNGLQVRTEDKRSVTTEHRDGLVKFIDRLDALRPFALLAGQPLWPFKWLRYGRHLHRKRDESMFKAKKVVVNATRNPGSAWRFVAAVAGQGVYFSDHFHGVIPKSQDLSLEEIAAVLNSAVANAWYDGHSHNRKIVIATLNAMPFPSIRPDRKSELIGLVRELEHAVIARWTRDDLALFYESSEETRDVSILLERVDSIVQEAYGLEPSETQRLWKFMSGDKRPA
jgi:N-6 DNA Methylase